MLELLEAVVEMVIVEAEVEVLPTKKSDVVFRRVGDGGVLLATQEEIYFGLNAVGVQIWELLTPENQTVGDVVGKLAEIYPDAEAPDLRMDLAEFFPKAKRQIRRCMMMLALRRYLENAVRKTRRLAKHQNVNRIMRTRALSVRTTSQAIIT